MNINHLLEFIYLSETLSFKSTADYFYVSRSVISRHLASLEDTLGVKLFDRGNQSVQLTEAGQVFYREIQPVLRAYGNAVDRTREVGKVSNRKVRIGYLKNAARPVIVKFAHYMHHEHPDIYLELSHMEYGELHRALDDGNVDIAISMNVDPRVAHNYRATHVYSDCFYAVMSRDNPLASRTEGVDISELPQDKLLLPDILAYAGLSEFIDDLVNKKVRVPAREYYADIDMLYLKVQAEGYLAFSSGLNNAMFGNHLVAIPIKDVDTSFSVSAFYNDGLSEDMYRMCRKGFESCHDAMNHLDNAAGESIIGFDLSSLD